MKNFKEFSKKYGNISEDDIINNYINDKAVFGEATKGIYEDVYSDIIGEDVSFDEVEECLNEADYEPILGATKKYGMSDGSDPTEHLKNLDVYSRAVKNGVNADPLTYSFKNGIDKIFDNNSNKKIMNVVLPKAEDKDSIKPFGIDPSKTLNISNKDNVKMLAGDIDTSSVNFSGSTTANSETKKGIFDMLKGFAASLASKIKNALTGSKEGTFKYWLSKGFNYIVDPANLPKVLGTTGGLILVGILIKALRKRNQLNKYKQLQYVYDSQKRAVAECVEGEDNVISEAMEFTAGDAIGEIAERAFGISIVKEDEEEENNEDEEENITEGKRKGDGDGDSPSYFRY